MSYQVQIQPPAAEDLDSAYQWIAHRSAERAEAWLKGAFATIQSLDVFDIE